MKLTSFNAEEPWSLMCVQNMAQRRTHPTGWRGRVYETYESATQMLIIPKKKGDVVRLPLVLRHDRLLCSGNL